MKRKRRQLHVKVGDVVTGRTKDGHTWRAVIGPSGRLIRKVIETRPGAWTRVKT